MVCIYHSGLWQCRDRKFLVCLRKYNCPLRKMQTAVSSLNEPLWRLNMDNKLDRQSDYLVLRDKNKLLFRIPQFLFKEQKKRGWPILNARMRRRIMEIRDWAMKDFLKLSRSTSEACVVTTDLSVNCQIQQNVKNCQIWRVEVRRQESRHRRRRHRKFFRLSQVTADSQSSVNVAKRPIFKG